MTHSFPTLLSSELANARLNSSMMYLAFNTENAKEGRQRFGTNSNVESKTTHSVAFAKLTDEQKARVEFRWNALTVKNAMGPKGTYRMAGIVCSVINDFCVSTDSDLDRKSTRLNSSH